MVTMPHQALDWGPDASAVQHYSLADHVVILGDSQIRLQGAPEDVLHSSRQILKTIIDDKEMKTSRQLDELVVKHRAQTNSTETAALNLTRRTGDLTVYGNEPL
jgi:ABC-type sulfate/molybdate transport systems ATPase subunit